MNQYKLQDDRLIYNILMTQATANLSVNVPVNTNSITIINQGNSRIVLNSTIFLYPGTVGTNSGESFTFGGNKGEVYKGSIDVAFNPTNTDNRAIIIFKVYINP